jgi:hypothetical protein
VRLAYPARYRFRQTRVTVNSAPSSLTALVGRLNPRAGPDLHARRWGRPADDIGRSHSSRGLFTVFTSNARAICAVVLTTA